MNNKHSLKNLIYKNYLTSSLIPIFAIEIVLLILYFTINNFIASQNKELLLKEVKEELQQINSSEAEKLDFEFSTISTYGKIIQTENERFFKNPASFNLPNGKPVFKLLENGVFYKVNDNGGASLFYGRRTKITKKEYEKALKTEAFDPLYKSIKNEDENIVAIYFNSYDEMNRYYPFIEDVYKQYDPNIHMEDFNFYYNADLKHNPERSTVWTDAYLDPAGKGWMISCVVPIYNGDFLEGVTGLDVTIENFVKNILNLELPWEAKVFLIDEKGMILAMPEEIENLLDLKELKSHVYNSTINKSILKPENYNIFKNKDIDLAKEFQHFLKKNTLVSNIKIKNKDFILCKKKIKETGWILLTLVDTDIIYKPIYALEKMTSRIGYIAIGLMAFFYIIFFLYLLRKSGKMSEFISQPIIYLTEATKQLGKEFKDLKIEKSGIDEIDSLSEDFVTMSQSLEMRTRELIDAKIREKNKEKEAELAYNAGLFESATSYLHNIGNSISAIDGKLLTLNRIIDSMEQYKEIFITIKEDHKKAISGEEDFTIKNIEKFEHIVLNKVMPKLKEFRDEISGISNHMILTIKHQQDSYLHSPYMGEKFIQKFDIKEVLEDIIHDFKPTFDKNNISIHLYTEENLFVINQKNQFIHGINNIIKNSMEAIVLTGHRGEISVKASGKNNKTEIIITDNGAGIREEDLKNVFKAGFTTKYNGHGLSLHSFINFLKENNSFISIISDGENKGTTVTLEVGNIEKDINS